MRAKKIILSTLLFLFISFLNLYAVKNNKKINLTLSFLLPSQEFATPFSAYYYDDKIYYRLPYNTLNDYTYFNYTVDWKFNSFINYGWGFGICLGGSGGNGISSIKVDENTDLAKAYGSQFYAIYNEYQFPFSLRVLFKLYSFNNEKYSIYLTSGCGPEIGIFTYNELIDKTRNSEEEKTEKLFFTLNPFLETGINIVAEVTKYLEPLTLTIKYRFTKNPILTNDFLISTIRRVQFQSKGVLIGIGFRY